MLLRIIGLTALGAFSQAPPADPGSSSSRYRVDQTLTQEIDATAAGQGKQRISFSTSSFLTVTLTDSTGGKVVRIVVDSIRGDTASPIPASVFDSARGTVYQGFLRPSGKLSDLEPLTTTPAATQIQGLLSDFFPWVRAGVKVGDQWADTSAQATGEGSDTVVVRRIVSYRAVGSEPRPTGTAVRVSSGYSSVVHGTQPTPNGPALIEGSGTGTGSYLLSPDGHYLGGDWHLQSTLSISGAFADDPLPITIDQVTKVTPLP